MSVILNIKSSGPLFFCFLTADNCQIPAQGILLGLCYELAELFRESPTLGVRIVPMRRRTLARSFETVDTPYGSVRVKLARGAGGELLSFKPEFADCRRIAEAESVPLKTVICAAESAFFEKNR